MSKWMIIYIGWSHVKLLKPYHTLVYDRGVGPWNTIFLSHLDPIFDPIPISLTLTIDNKIFEI